MKKKQHKQPISLKFNGEKLQIIEAGKVLKEYEARIGDNTAFSPEAETMLIHGGKDYEDKGGIDLSTGADEFFEYLNYLVTEKYINKL
ncbi:hypothetical protein LS68_004540 [Helicobacter sp. MIT 05-5293]|uniref:hypothetical protein n=1 Tax=Helicobacter sp. MIT 05-5293 TaxID=1548149 RepID=UPI00055949A6|nr:hypothetical protein [Helicobacter sp. MIT 05-5293]TLD82263.1 hypothetical protein LS68_004540 [Helicobacter sp. MIT 05-5293]